MQLSIPRRLAFENLILGLDMSDSQPDKTVGTCESVTSKTSGSAAGFLFLPRGGAILVSASLAPLACCLWGARSGVA